MNSLDRCLWICAIILCCDIVHGSQNATDSCPDVDCGQDNYCENGYILNEAGCVISCLCAPLPVTPCANSVCPLDNCIHGLIQNPDNGCDICQCFDAADFDCSTLVDSICTDNSERVCGLRDGVEFVTYDNNCAFRLAQCDSTYRLSFQHSRKCAQDGIISNTDGSSDRHKSSLTVKTTVIILVTVGSTLAIAFVGLAICRKYVRGKKTNREKSWHRLTSMSDQYEGKSRESRTRQRMVVTVNEEGDVLKASHVELYGHRYLIAGSGITMNNELSLQDGLGLLRSSDVDSDMNESGSEGTDICEKDSELAFVGELNIPSNI